MPGVATYQVNGPGGAVYRVQGPEGADPSQILAAMGAQGSASTPTPASGGWLNGIALAGRDVGEGVLDTLAAPHDLGIDLQNAVTGLSNRYLGTHIAPQHTFGGQLSRALTYLGAPVPSTADQQLGASVLKGVSGALTGGGILGLAGLPNALRMALSGATGGASANVARQAGAGPLGQFIAGTVGGIAPSALESGVGLVPKAIAPFTRAGQAQLAANTLVREATDPVQAAANLSTAEPLVPGSLRTTGEASGDTGLLALEKGIRARNPGAFGERVSQQNGARQAELASVGGTPADIAAAQAFRENETAPMRESAFAAARNLREANPLPAQDVAPESLGPRNYATSDPTQDSILQWLAKNPRGLDSTEAQAQGLDPSEFGTQPAMVGIKRAFRKGGMSFDQAAEALHQAGYPVADEAGNYDPNVLLDAIDGELRGNPVYSLGNTRQFGELEQALTERNAAATPPDAQPPQAFPGRAPVNRVHDVIDQLLASPAGARESIGKTLRWAKGLIGENDDPETLYEVRKDLALAQRDQLQPGGRDAPNATMLAQARGQLGKVIGSLDDAIESAAPGYKDYLSRYRELSEPIDQMSAIQDLQKRTSSGLDTATGEPFLSGPQFARQLRSTLERADGPFSPRLTPEQTQRLEAVREDLQRAGAVGNPTVRTPGSDTFQNFMTGQRTGSGLLSHVPVLGKFLGPVSKYVDARVNAQLSDAMLNPERAAQLLRQGSLPMPVRLAMARGLSRAALPATTGPLAALARPTASTGLLPHPSAITAWLEQRLSPLTGLSPAVAPSNVLQALGMTIEPGRWAQEVNSGRANPAMEDKLAGLHGSLLRGHVHRLLGNARSGVVRGPGGMMHMRQGPGRHVTVLPPSAAGGVPQVLSGIVSMPR